MKNVSNNTLLFFYAVPGVTLLVMFIILFFAGTTSTEQAVSHMKYIYAESDDKHSIIFLNLIMAIWLISAVLIKTSLINSALRSTIILVTLFAITLFSFIYLMEFIALISIPALVYGSIYTKQMHKESLNLTGAKNAPPS